MSLLVGTFEDCYDGVRLVVVGWGPTGAVVAHACSRQAVEDSAHNPLVVALELAFVGTADSARCPSELKTTRLLPTFQLMSNGTASLLQSERCVGKMMAVYETLALPPKSIPTTRHSFLDTSPRRLTRRVRNWGAVVLVPVRLACRGGSVVTEKREVEDAMVGKKALNRGAVFLDPGTSWEQCRGGSVVTEKEEGSRGLVGSTASSSGLVLRCFSQLVMFGDTARC